MERKPTEEQLQEWGKQVADSLNGFAKEELEPLFERFVLPFYYAVCTYPNDINKKSKWKIVNRESGKEYDRVLAFKKLRDIGAIK